MLGALSLRDTAMSDNSVPAKCRHLHLALVLVALWFASWALFALSPEDIRPLGLPLITWGHIVLGVLAVAFSFGAVLLIGAREDAS